MKETEKNGSTKIRGDDGEQLREVASRFALPQIMDRNDLVDAVMLHIERNGPGQGGEASRGSDPERPPGGSRRPSERSDTDEEAPVTATRLRQVLTAVTADMAKQQKEMQQQQLQFLQQQQQQFTQLVQMLTER